MATWYFNQLGGPRKTLRLTGASAPHGRPRQDPVVTDGIEIRKVDVYYPGNSIPTRHVFGYRLTPWELEGRFENTDGGPGYASMMVEYVKQFVADAQPVLIMWGTLIAAEGFIESFEPGRESAGSVKWTLKVAVDEDLNIDRVKSQPKLRKLKDLTETLMAAMYEALGDEREGTYITTFPRGLDLGFSDALDMLVGLINEPIAMFSDLVDEIGDLERATAGSIKRLRAGINQIKTACMNARNVYEDARADFALKSSFSEYFASFSLRQNTTTSAMLFVLDALRELDRACAIAERGQIAAFYTAREGDTWMSIARTTTGSASNASAIQDANSVAGPPVPGEIYAIPNGLGV